MVHGRFIRTKSLKYLMLISEDRFYLIDTDVLWRGYVSPIFNWMSPVKCTEITSQEFNELEFEVARGWQDNIIAIISIALIVALQFINISWLAEATFFQRMLTLFFGFFLACCIKLLLFSMTEYKVKKVIKTTDPIMRTLLFVPPGKIIKVFRFVTHLIFQFIIIGILYFCVSSFLNYGSFTMLIATVALLLFFSHISNLFIIPINKLERDYNIKFVDNK